MMNRTPLCTKPLVIFLFGFILLAQSIFAEAQTPQQIARKAFKAMVLLVMEDANGQPFSIGSGFFVKEGVIASNLHVVEGASRGYAKVVGQRTKFNIEGIVGIDQNRDLVILKISGAPTPALVLGNSDAVEVGEPVYAVGNPQGLEGTFPEGIVSSIRQAGSDKLLQITAPISPGSSGGPVLNTKGEVVGVSVATFSGGQNLNFAIPSNYLAALIRKLESLKPLSRAKSATKRRSILADLGGRSAEGVVGGQFTWDTYSQLGNYSFSFRNKLRETVRNIYCLVIFYDSQGAPIDIDVVRYHGSIPAGLARRVESKVHKSVEKLNTPLDRSPPRSPQNKVEFRILDFQIVE